MRYGKDITEEGKEDVAAQGVVIVRGGGIGA